MKNYHQEKFKINKFTMKKFLLLVCIFSVGFFVLGCTPKANIEFSSEVEQNAYGGDTNAQAEVKVMYQNIINELEQKINNFTASVDALIDTENKERVDEWNKDKNELRAKLQDAKNAVMIMNNAAGKVWSSAQVSAKITLDELQTNLEEITGKFADESEETLSLEERINITAELQQELDEVKNNLAQLKLTAQGKINGAGSEVLQRWQDLQAELQKRQQEADIKLDELRQASANAWADARLKAKQSIENFAGLYESAEAELKTNLNAEIKKEDQQP